MGGGMNRMLFEGERKALQTRLDVLNRIKPDCNSCVNLAESGKCLVHKRCSSRFQVHWMMREMG